MAYLLCRAALPAAAAAAALVPWPREGVDRIYARGIYPHIQPLLTRATNTVPFAWLDVLIAVAGVSVIWVAVRARRRGATRLVALGASIWHAVALVSAAYLLFLALWGLNYQRPAVDRRFAVAPVLVQPARLRLVSILAVRQLNHLYDPQDRFAEAAPSDLVVALAPAFAQAQLELGSTWHAIPGRPKHSSIAATFRWIAVDGLTNPFGLEIVLNPELLPVERPFVLAHEWAHLAGHADEGEATFTGWLTCLHGPRAAQYSAWLGLLVHLVRALPPEERQMLLRNLGRGPTADWRQLLERYRRSNAFLRQISWRVYDRYLKANRVESGIESYDDVVRLVLGAPVAQRFVQ